MLKVLLLVSFTHKSIEMSGFSRGFGASSSFRRHRPARGGKIHHYSTSPKYGNLPSNATGHSFDRRRNDGEDHKNHGASQNVHYEEDQVFSKHKHKNKKDFGDKGTDTDSLQGKLQHKTKLRPPPGLKGKEIGLWYCQQQKKKANMENITEIGLSAEAKCLLQDICSRTPIYQEKSDVEVGSVEEFEHFEESFETRIEKADDTPFQNDVNLDLLLYEGLKKKQKYNSNYQDMYNARQNIPSFKLKDQIVELIKNNQIVVVSGGTGCGKTTQVVQFVLDDFIMRKQGSLCSIVCTQPRRISAVTVAERVASERAENLGESVGYHIRLECVSPSRQRGCIVFMTTGIVLQLLKENPILSGISHLFLDEIHERTVESDFILALLNYILPKRPDLKVILMSATLNSMTFSKYFGGIPVIEIPGFLYPVQEIYLDEILKYTKFKFSQNNQNPHQKLHWARKEQQSDFQNYILPYVRDLEKRGIYPRWVTEQLSNPESEALNVLLMADTVQYICNNEPDGAILVFVPGLFEIQKLQKELMSRPFFSSSRHRIIGMHSTFSTTQQKEAFDRPPKGVRKIIIATNILETSITINDVVYVVDTGKNKTISFDKERNISTLDPTWITSANVKQRSGRAGRLQPGKCYKLYTKVRESLFDSYPLPEILNVRLEGVILKVKMLNLGNVAPFLQKLIDPPDPQVVELSLKVLRNLNALDNKERLTSLGHHLAQLPLDPHTGKMIIMAALYGCIDPIFSIAACLSYKDPFVFSLDREKESFDIKMSFSKGEKSDHLIFSEVLKQWEAARTLGESSLFAYTNCLSNSTLKLISDMKSQFARHLHDMNFLFSPDPKDPRSNVNSENVSLLKAILCAGLYPNVAVMKKKVKKRRGVILMKTIDHPKVLFHRKSFCSEIDEFNSSLCIYHLKLKSSDIFLHDVTVIDPVPLLFFGDKFTIVDKVNYNISVDNFIKFKCGREDRNLLKALRKRLDQAIESFIANPEPINWEQLNPNDHVLGWTVSLLNPKYWNFVDHQVES